MTGAGIGSVVLVALLHAGAGVVGPAPAERLAAAHSHNDQEQAEPLALALGAGFASVEVDVGWRRGRMAVAHSPLDPDRGDLEALYLRPLQERVDRLGSVYGDGRPFWLWIDLKDGAPALVEALAAVLDRYPMLTAFVDAAVVPGPVTVVLTGDGSAKRRYVEGRALRRACRDANALDPADGPADRRFTWYALPWSHLVAEAPSEPGFRAALVRMGAVVERIHALGRRVRLYGVPERPEAWAGALAAGVDLVSTDRLATFRAWLLRAAPGPAPREGVAEAPRRARGP